MPYDKRTASTALNAIMFAVPETDGNEPTVFLQDPTSDNIETSPMMSWGRGTRGIWFDANGSIVIVKCLI